MGTSRTNGLKVFDLYEFLEHQNAHSFNVPFFLADRHTYKKAHVNFPFRTFAYGLGVTYIGEGDIFKIGNTDYQVGSGCLTTVGPGMVCQWMGNYTAEHDTVYFTEELFSVLQNNSFLQSLAFFFHGGNHVIRLNDEQLKKMASLFDLLKALKDDKNAIVVQRRRLCHGYRPPSHNRWPMALMTRLQGLPPGCSALATLVLLPKF